MKEFVERLKSRLEEEKHIVYEYESSSQYEATQRTVVDYEDIIEIVNELEEECNNDCCEWKFMKTVVAYFYSSGCNHKRFSDLHDFEFCPYCGKKIKVVK